YYFCLKKFSKEEIIKKGFDSEIVEKVIKRIKETEYKRKLPIKISSFNR
ncbi:MAG: hypothetical protein ACK4YO_00925, partial [Candidatus Altarchaeaceae archaeon]